MLTVTLGGADRRREKRLDIQVLPHRIDWQHSGVPDWGKTMTKPESKRSSVAANDSTGKGAEHVNNGPVESMSSSMRAGVLKQSSRENLHRKNTECEVYDDGTNTFFWWVLSDGHSDCFYQNKSSFFRSCNRLHNEFQGHLNTNTWSPNTRKIVWHICFILCYVRWIVVSLYRDILRQNSCMRSDLKGSVFLWNLHLPLLSSLLLQEFLSLNKGTGVSVCQSWHQWTTNVLNRSSCTFCRFRRGFKWAFNIWC